ncbi:MAG: hypothetical protein Q9166_006659 [cf. Caloplaca sp. 2 TL-2023]
MADNQGWPKQKINTVNRYRNRGISPESLSIPSQSNNKTKLKPFDQGIYDYQTVNTIVDQTPILHVSFSASSEPDEPPFPVILPMLGATSAYPDPSSDDKSESRIIYLHGYVSSRILRMAGKATNAEGSEVHGSSNTNGYTSGDNGIPICVCATLLDGIVLALTPNHHSCNYRSAVIFGHAHVVTDEPERLHAMQLITNNLVPERWENTRYPNATELKSTGILRVEIQSASAKVRQGSTGEDKKDLKDEQMRTRVWNGVIPAFMQWGRPEPASTNMCLEGGKEGAPKYVTRWVEEDNRRNERAAYEIARAEKN